MWYGLIATIYTELTRVSHKAEQGNRQLRFGSSPQHEPYLGMVGTGVHSCRVHRGGRSVRCRTARSGTSHLRVLQHWCSSHIEFVLPSRHLLPVLLLAASLLTDTYLAGECWVEVDALRCCGFTIPLIPGRHSCPTLEVRVRKVLLFVPQLCFTH